MLYMILGEDNADSLSRRQATRPAHLERVQALQDQGRLVLAGPLPLADGPDSTALGFSGSLIVAEFSDLASAQNWAQADPYVSAGVYKQVTVKPFKQVLP